MNNIKSIINKNLEHYADKLSKSDWEQLSKELTNQINAVLPAEVGPIVTIEERIESSISHITDPGLYALLEGVLKNQMNYIMDNLTNGTQCMACTASRVEKDCKLQIPLVIIIFEALYPALNKMISIQPMTGPVGLALLLRLKENEEESGKFSLQMINKAIEAGSRKLQAYWTIEAAQDMHAIHGDVDVYNEIIKALGHEIFHEISSEILGHIRQLGMEPGMPDDSSPRVVHITQGKSLITEIDVVSRRVGNACRRGNGNFVLLSPEALTLIQCEPSSKFQSTVRLTSVDKQPGPIHYVGDLLFDEGARKVTVMCDMMDDTNSVTVGYKGDNEADAGYVYAPYIPLMSTGVVLNYETFEPQMSFMTRCGRTPFDSTEVGAARSYFETFTITSDFTALLGDEDNAE